MWIEKSLLAVQVLNCKMNFLGGAGRGQSGRGPQGSEEIEVRKK